MTGTITSIIQQGKTIVIGVTFSDNVTSFSAQDIFTVPATTTQTEVVDLIQAKGQEYKAVQSRVANLQSRVGSIINIT